MNYHYYYIDNTYYTEMPVEKKTRKIPLKDPTMPNQHPNDDTYVIRPQYHGTNMLQHSIFIRRDNYVISDIYRIPPVPYSFLLDDLVTRAN